MYEWIATLIITHDWAWFPAMVVVIVIPCLLAQKVNDFWSRSEQRQRDRRCR